MQKENSSLKNFLTQILKRLHRYCQPEDNFHRVKMFVTAQCCKVISCRLYLSFFSHNLSHTQLVVLPFNYLSASN